MPYPPAAKSQVTVSVEPDTPELFEGYKEFLEGDRNVTYNTLLVPYLKGAKFIHIIDPYIRNFAQIRNLMELLEFIAREKSATDEVTVNLTTAESPESPELAQKQREFLGQVGKSAAQLGIQLEVDLVPDRSIHDRSITTDNGWKIVLGRGLDIFQPVIGGAFDLASKHQRYRQVKAFSITYLKSPE